VHDLAAALRGLTVRGRSFLAAGAACAGSALVLGEQDLLRVALLLLLLPLSAALFVSRTRYRLSCTRRVDPPRVTAGQPATVRIRLDNLSRLPTSVLLVEDTVPERLGTRPRFVLDRIEPGGTREVTYQLTARQRGRYEVGPMSIRLTDPFGFCELTRGFRSRDELIVAPAVERLAPARLERHSAASALRRPTLRGEDEATTRPYQSGDDLRRVHWRTTARVGELMVRREEAPVLGGATILLDDHLSSWGPVAAGPASPFEWAVAAAASVAAHFSGTGYGVRLVTHRGLAATSPPGNAGPVLDELATITPAPILDERAAFRAMAGGDAGMPVLVLGRTSPEVARRLGALRPRSAPGIAVLVDLGRWGPLRGAAEDLAGCEQALMRAGWRVLVTGHGSRLADDWATLARPVVRLGAGARRYRAAAAASARPPGAAGGAGRAATVAGPLAEGGGGDAGVGP
jgi:uncharacterized protein (DUF58 family)